MALNSSAKLSSPRAWDAAVLVKDLDKAVKQLETLGIVRAYHPDLPAGAEVPFYFAVTPDLIYS